MKYRAVIVGASGLVGHHLLELLLQNDSFVEIRSFSRKKIGVSHPKLQQFEVDFEQFDQYSELFQGDVAFCCVGTTIKIAGSKEKFRSVDYEIPCKMAQMAVKNRIGSFIVISSLGASSKSSNFYLKTKGQMQDFIGGLDISRKVFIHPSLLLGERPEYRTGERIGEIVLRALGFLLIGSLKKYKAIHATEVAKAMVMISLDLNMKGIIQSDKLKKLAYGYKA
ncbi:MAG: NAD(P)H-binding protein [Bacteroidales bacterium]|nr:NAD(P)H-binding protein [Bacteroidales bacterium]